MPLCTIDEFENEILNFEALRLEISNVGFKEAAYGQEVGDEGGGGSEDPGVFVFYQNDIDGICAMFILEHHNKLSQGVRLTSYPILSEIDIYTWIKKNLSIQSAQPDLQFDYYLRVILLGVHGWHSQVLYAIKVYFEQLMPEELRGELKISIITAQRPISFFGVSYDAIWYFFVQNEDEVVKEREASGKIPSGIYAQTSVAQIVANITTITHEPSKAAVLYASAVGLLHRSEHVNVFDLNLNSSILAIFKETALLDGGPFVKYDTDMSILPLISFTSFSEALRMSPSILLYDPQRRSDTFADLRIQCNLKPEEFTSEFCNLDAQRQSNVLRSLKKRIRFFRDRTQLCWLRRTNSISATDMIYLLLTILVGWRNKSNEWTWETAPVVASDLLYNTLMERMNQDSFYDRVVYHQLKVKAYEMINSTYDLITKSKVKERRFGSTRVNVATVYPRVAVRHPDHLCFMGYLLANLQNQKEGCRCLIFIVNPDNLEPFCYGYSPESTAEFPDVWPLVFNSIAHDDESLTYDPFKPNIIAIGSGDVTAARNKLLQRLRIALEVSFTGEESEESLE